ncbi:serine/threonine-protein kinase [Magnetospirillum sp. SS-4]|uniref:serine/threonine-protein kinase n=1 Tax=Magnetospirillum sp. SS-4 TaxID=2681465 RepID=UPI00138375FE|nr:serine/threonine-protein kinase [Magnetospirillum sp. SS-4]CAA7625793.1 Serine/threonine protein kinase [Magnetospirillum sp. SS-4]
MTEGEQPARPPPSLAGWRFVHRLVETDFSDIWLAEDMRLGRRVAVKIFALKLDGNGTRPPFDADEWRRRFIQEARLLARFDHPHIIPVVALDRLDDGRPAIFMQALSGSLRREIGTDDFEPEAVAAMGESERPRAASPARTRQVLLELLSALVAIHGKGIVHRDIKPRNLLLSNGTGSRIKLIDFGMAKAPDEKPAAEPFWIGTRDYISPEQYADSAQATDRSDIFSVGVIGIRMLTGSFPDREKLRAVQGLPPAFADLLCRALSYRAGQRPSALEMARNLAAIPLPRPE